MVKKVKSQHIPQKMLTMLLREAMEKGVSFTFHAKGESMYPTIVNGDLITVAPIKEQIPSIGQIICFVQPESGRLIVHRIVQKVDGKFITQGDNICYEDGMIGRENILGIVSYIQPRKNKSILKKIIQKIRGILR